jgi:aspartate-semialdehyde dehydrogenase
MERKIEVGILGATGMVGQHFVRFLQGHPWFDLKWLGASDRSAGKKYRDATKWLLGGNAPEDAMDILVEECRPGHAPQLVFSAMDASVATEVEQEFAKTGHTVLSNCRNHRMDADVPLLVPEINPDHLKLVSVQQRTRGWCGQIVTNPNCSTVVLAMGLAPLKPFDITQVVATTLQAISGAGYPGVPSTDITANVIPYIGGEEEKMQQETQKILGTLAGDRIQPLPAGVSAHCNRVPVLDGHTVTISVALAAKPSFEEILRAFDGFLGLPQQRRLPSAPPRPVIHMPDQDRPQPRRDAEREHGMAAFVGRLRACPVLGYKFVALGHNTIRGAAGAAVLNAELMLSEGMLG